MAVNSASFAQERHKSSDSSVAGIKSDGLVGFFLLVFGLRTLLLSKISVLLFVCLFVCLNLLKFSQDVYMKSQVERKQQQQSCRPAAH